MPPLVAKPRTFRELGPVDCDRLARLVARISPGTWTREDAIKENRFEVFHHTRHIVFRFTAGNRNPEEWYANPAWDAWQAELLPIMHAAIASYGFRQPVFPKAMLARLEAGAVIDPHVDGAGSNLRTHKIHVPLITNPHALFTCGEETRHLPAGHACEVNNVGPHGASNLGPDDRIHFIFEVYEADHAAHAAAAADAAV